MLRLAVGIAHRHRSPNEWSRLQPTVMNDMKPELVAGLRIKSLLKKRTLNARRKEELVLEVSALAFIVNAGKQIGRMVDELQANALNE